MTFISLRAFWVCPLVLSALLPAPAAVALEAAPYLEGGSIEVVRELPTPEEAAPGSLILSYGRVDPLSPTTLEVRQLLAQKASAPVMVLHRSRLLTLQQLRIETSDGGSLLHWSRNELNALRVKARAGAAIVISSTGTRTELDSREQWELPARSMGLDLNQAESEVLDLIRLDDTEDSLLRLRAITSASESFHQQLIALAEKTPTLDARRLVLILDGVVFTAPQVSAIRSKLRELGDSADQVVQRRILEANLAVAQKFMTTSNRLLMLGLKKLNRLTFSEAEAVLQRLHRTEESTNIAFQLAFERLGNSFDALTPAEKVQLFQLAARKGAFEFAVPLGRNWFERDSDRTMSAVLDLVRVFPPGSLRDELSSLALTGEGPINAAEFAALTAPIQSRELLMNLFRSISPRLTDLKGAQALTLVSQQAAGDLRDQLLLSIVPFITDYQSDDLRNLLLACSTWSSRTSLVENALPRIPGDAAKQVGAILVLLPEEPNRDTVALKTIERSAILTPDALLALFRSLLSRTAADQLFELGLAKVSEIRIIEAATLSDSLDRPGFAIESYRDQVLLHAAQRATDLSSENLDALLSRASSESVRVRIQDIAAGRLQKP